MKALCELEERHGIDLGPAYTNDHACATFVEFIALEQKEQLLATLAGCRYFRGGGRDLINVRTKLFLT